MKYTLLILSYLVSGAAAWAEEPTWFDVEIIIFSNTDQNNLASEIWPDDPGLPDDENTIELSSVETSNSVSDTDAIKESKTEPAEETVLESAAEADLEQLNAMPHAFQILPESEFKLGDAEMKLENSRDHTPLLHIAWRQPVVAKENSKAIHLYTDIGKPPADTSETGMAETVAETDNSEPASDTPAAMKINFDGNIMISRGRYLHLDTDLLFTRKTDLQIYSFFLPLEEETISDNFRVQASRRMRSGDLHYIDHPLIGILALITPYELPEEEADKIEVIPLQD